MAWSNPPLVRGVRSCNSSETANFDVYDIGEEGDERRLERYPGGHHLEGEVAELFVIEDAPSLGHMMMSFVQLFSWIYTAARRSEDEILDRMGYKGPNYGEVSRRNKTAEVGGATTIYVTFQHNYDHPAKRALFEPLLSDIKDFAASELAVHLVDIDYTEDIVKNFPCPADSGAHRLRVSVRGCTNHPKGLDWTGHCAAWFDSAPSVRRWRSFLRKSVDISYFWGHNEPNWDSKVRNRNPRDGEKVLVFDRARGEKRSLTDPNAVIQWVEESCSVCNVTYYAFEEADKESELHGGGNTQSWKWNAHFFAMYDIIVIVHGAAVTNQLYSAPGTGLIEIGRGDGDTSMYMPLGSQLGLWRKGVPFSGPGFNDFDGQVMPNPIHLKDAVSEITTLRKRLITSQEEVGRMRKLVRAQRQEEQELKKQWEEKHEEQEQEKGATHE